MAQEQQATMTLPLDLVKPAIDAQVEAAILKAMGSSDQLVAKIVESIMVMKVDSEGKTGGYRCEIPWLTWAVNDIIKKAIQKAITEHLAKNAVQIENAITAEMKKNKSPLVQSLVSSMAVGMAKSLENSYKININFETR
jgi:hypothetical protein